MKRLGVLIDGVPLAEAEAHALWDRFSLYMDEHRGDLAGFAAKEGFLSIHPGVDGDRPVLRASKTATQKPYASVKPSDQSGQGDPKPRQPSGGSRTPQGGPSHGARTPSKRPDSAKKSAR